MNFCEHVQDVLVNFVVKLSIVSEVVFLIIKLVQDALKELIETNCCKYDLEGCHLLKFTYL